MHARATHAQVVPRTLAENSGLNATEVVSQLYTAHASGQINAGLDVDGGAPRDLSSEAAGAAGGEAGRACGGMGWGRALAVCGQQQCPQWLLVLALVSAVYGGMTLT